MLLDTAHFNHLGLKLNGGALYIILHPTSPHDSVAPSTKNQCQILLIWLVHTTLFNFSQKSTSQLLVCRAFLPVQPVAHSDARGLP